MGIDKGIQTLYCHQNLSKANIADICRGLAADRNMTRLAIDVDFNNVAFVVGGKSKDGRMVMGAVADHLMKWLGCGVRLVPVCDGTRPIGK